MFDKIFEILAQLWGHFVPIEVIKQYEKGVRLRFGKLKDPDMNPGLHFKIPFVDEIVRVVVTVDTLEINPITITTTDNITVIIGAVLEFEINNINKYIIETNEARSNAHDICRGIMADYLTDRTWIECKDKKTIRTIIKLLTKKFEEMGIKVISLIFTDMCVTRSYKLFEEKRI